MNLEQVISVSPRVVATLLARLARKAQTPVSRAAEKHEKAMRRVFLDAVKQAQDDIPMGNLEAALNMPGTGAPLHVLQPIIDRFLEPTKLRAHEPYVRLAAAKSTVTSVLSDSLNAGANATEMCVIPSQAEAAGVKLKAPKATKAQIDEAWSMHQAGKSYKEIKDVTGLNEKQAATIVFKIKKQAKTVQGLAAPAQIPTMSVKKLKVPKGSTPATTPPSGAATTTSLTPDKVAKFIEGHPSGKGFDQFWYEKKKWHGFTDAEISANLAKQGIVSDDWYVKQILAKGEEAAKAFEAAKSSAANLALKARQEALVKGMPIGPAAPGEGWPIADSVVRSAGRNYPTQVKDAFNGWVNSLTVAERTAIESYTASGYASMNTALRSGVGGGKRVADLAKALEKAKAAGAPPPPELVWRGVKDPTFSSKIASGDIVELKGFQSTSIKPEFAADWGSGVLLEIKPSGGAYVQQLSSHRHEYEFLLPHGAKYRIRGETAIEFYHQATGKTVKRRVIQLEMLP